MFRWIIRPDATRYGDRVDMPNPERLTEYDEWHSLLDALCNERGHFENSRLAAEICALAGAKGETAFDAALKNLGNWRRGLHVPHRRNFAMLGRILDIDSIPGLRPHWNALYLKSKEKAENAVAIARVIDVPALDIPSQPQAPSTPHRAGFFRVAALVCMGLVSAGGYTLWRNHDSAPAPVPITVEYRPAVQLMIGESVVIHGMRSPKCGDPAPDWEAVLRRFPLTLETGRLSDGGVGVRSSASCATPTPVRVVTFTAHKPGVEEINMFGDPIRIEVRLRPPSARLIQGE